jgi:aarF domain-containing kinase
MIPEAYLKNLEPLSQEGQMTDFSIAKKLIEDELKINVDECFEYFEEKPIRSSSIGQVHRAKLREDGQELVIKIQHPNIRMEYPLDIAVVNFAISVGEFIFPEIKLSWIVEEFSHNIKKEIDFIKEAQNCDKIGKLFKDDDRIVIPKIFWNLTTNRVLSMSNEKGGEIKDKNYRINNLISSNDISNLLANMLNRQIFEFGFVHSNPFSSNISVRREKVKGKMMTRLVLLDHGLYYELSKEFIASYATLCRGTIN